MRLNKAVRWRVWDDRFSQLKWEWENNIRSRDARILEVELRTRSTLRLIQASLAGENHANLRRVLQMYDPHNTKAKALLRELSVVRGLILCAIVGLVALLALGLLRMHENL